MRKTVAKLLLVILTISLCVFNTPKEVLAFSLFYKAPQITKQPEDFEGEYGEIVEFSVKATSSWGLRLRYQWFYKNPKSNRWLEAPNGNKALVSYTFENGMDDIQVICSVTDGFKTTYSKVVSVTHVPAVEPEEPETPVQPETPIEPEEPDTPVQPEEPETPEEPELPDLPDNPEPPIIEDEPVLPDNPVVDIPVEDEPIIDEPVVDEPVVDEPVIDEPVVDEPVVDEPVVDEPVIDEPVVDEPVVDEPTVDEPAVDEPVVDEPVVDEPTVDEPTVEIPADELPSDYVTPEMFGAKADGVTDDSAAIQKAVNSGKTVVFSSDKTYFIAANKYILIQNKNGLRMIGGRIHKEASASNYNLFVLYGCSDCSFENMYIYSEMTCRDILIPANHYRPTNLSSNVLAFSGVSNSNIRFINNRFDNMSSDYWFNGRAGEGWSDITVDGWNSSTSCMPMYAQQISNLTVTHATVEMNPEYAGDGDHCIYICTGADGVYVSDSAFTWNGQKNRSGAIAVLTFHGGDADAGTMPKNIHVSGCTVAAGQGKAFYCGPGVDVSIDGCILSNAASESVTNLPVMSGYGYFTITNSSISTYDTVFDAVSNLYLENCDISGGASLGIFAFTPNLTVVDSRINIKGGVLYYASQGDGNALSFKGCTINKTERGLGYIISRRTAGGTFTFDSCDVNCGGGQFVYNGGRGDFTGITLNNCQINNCSSLATSAELKNYSITNTYVNNRLFG